MESSATHLVEFGTHIVNSSAVRQEIGKLSSLFIFIFFPSVFLGQFRDRIVRCDTFSLAYCQTIFSASLMFDSRLYPLRISRACEKEARIFTALRCDSHGDAGFGKGCADARWEGMRRLARHRISQFW